MVRERPLYFSRGGGGGYLKKEHSRKLLKKSCKGSHGEKIEQVLSTIQVLCFSYNNSSTSFRPPKKTMLKLKARKRFHARNAIFPEIEKIARPPTLLKRNTGPSLSVKYVSEWEWNNLPKEIRVK